MSSGILLILQLGSLLLLAFSLARPKLRPLVALLLAGLGMTLLALAALNWGEERSLAISHSFRAFQGQDLAFRSFAIETNRVAAQYWSLWGAAFALGWAGWAYWAGKRPSATFGAPFALAITGCLLILGWEKLAAPAILLTPFDLAPERVLIPAGLAAVLLLVQSGRRLLPMLAYLSLFLGLTRLPLTIFGTLATKNHWGTHLDVHNTTFIAPPGSENSGGLELLAGSEAQLAWLVWFPHLMLYPAFYMMALGGLAFFLVMLDKQRQVDALGN